MRDLRELGEHELDALREVANIGAGHAATALSQLTNRRILVDVPQIRFAGLRVEAGGEEVQGDMEATVSMQVLGDITGRTMQVFPGPTASRLAGILIGASDVAFPDGFGELEQSALKEAGNIIAGAYLNALSDFMGMLLLMSVPAMRIAPDSLMVSLRDTPREGDELVLLMETNFQMEGDERPLKGHFILVPDSASFPAIFEAIRLP
ncbi:MAG TPA: chemotaxis protein CheC [Longimicrobiales bacterium]|nr:chemotaxis protein CheC [Longimicrobiales bacterium]